MDKLSARDSILIGLLTLALGIVIVYCVFQPQIMNRNIIEIDIAEEGTKVVSFDGFSVLPGEEKGYTFVFDEVDVTPYDVAFQFKSKMDSDSYNFIYVRIIVDGEILQDKQLNQAFADDPTIVHIEPLKDRDVDVKIVYYIPIDVGNEAQNVELDFDLIVTTTTLKPVEEAIK